MLTRLFSTLSTPALRDFLREQTLRDLVAGRRFRITQQYLDEVVIPRIPDLPPDFTVTLKEGVIEISGRYEKRPLPAIPFRATLSVAGVRTTSDGPEILLRIDDFHPSPLRGAVGWIVDRIPFLSSGEGALIFSPARIGGLGDILGKRVGNRRLAQLLTLTDLQVHERELVAVAGIVI